MKSLAPTLAAATLLGCLALPAAADIRAASDRLHADLRGQVMSRLDAAPRAGVPLSRTGPATDSRTVYARTVIVDGHVLTGAATVRPAPKPRGAALPDRLAMLDTRLALFAAQPLVLPVAGSPRRAISGRADMTPPAAEPGVIGNRHGGNVTLHDRLTAAFLPVSSAGAPAFVWPAPAGIGRAPYSGFAFAISN